MKMTGISSTMLPCATCGTVTHERTNFGGLTDEYYCVDNAACRARLKENARKQAIEDNKEIETDENKRAD